MEMIEGDGGVKEGRDSRKQNGMEEERISEKERCDWEKDEEIAR